MRVQIADDHPVVRDGLRLALAAMPYVELTPDICGGQDFMAQVQQSQADILICDVRMPNFEIVPTLLRLQANEKHPQVLVISGDTDRELVQAVAAAGAAGYVLKDELRGHDLPNILLTLAAGHRWFSPGVSNYLTPVEDELSPRECQVVVLMRTGAEPSEIAQELNLSLQRIYNLQHALRQKYEVATNEQLLLKLKKN